MSHEDSDWRILNAFADGELADAEARRFEQRLTEEPELRSELGRVRDLKRKLAAMRPLPETAIEPVAAAPRWHSRVAAAAAAVVAILALIVIAETQFMRDHSTWLEHAVVLHGEQSQRAFVVDERHVVQTVSSGRSLEFRAPDLTESRLFLVEIASSLWNDRETITIHYRGLRGCRLTVAAIEAGAAPGEMAGSNGPDALMRTWTYDGFHFAVIADGMDVDRFARIADYVNAAVKVPVIEDRRMRTAMAESYREARPCA